MFRLFWYVGEPKRMEFDDFRSPLDAMVFRNTLMACGIECEPIRFLKGVVSE